jgi:M6 family metalloprotease-like protein
MRKSIKTVVPLFVSMLLLSSCSFGDFLFSSSATNQASSVSTSSTQEASSVKQFLENKTDPFTKGQGYFRSMITDSGMYSAPSTGNAKMLVVPVVFKDDASLYTDSSVLGKKTKANLTSTFFGTADDTGYWESVSSYYAKSSYGKLNITGAVAPFYQLSLTVTQGKTNAKNSVTKVTNSILDSVYQNLFPTGGTTYDGVDYDGDGDGVIDFIWLVYCHDYDSKDTTNLMWAYTYWDDNASFEALENYSWASSSFMNDGTTFGVDAHTYIHETGHQMGLDDYYSYDEYSTADKKRRAPIGASDMMDYNIVDHCSFTKYCLDWITPTVGEADKTYTLKPFESSGDCLLLAYDFNGTCFDEYFLLEYYTPTGLNKQDSEDYYSNFNFKGLTDSGLRILHVDQRIGKEVHTSSGWAWDGKYYDDVSPLNANNAYYAIISNNTKEKCLDSKDFCLVSLVQASGNTNLLSDSASDIKYAVNDDLFDMTSKVFGKDIWNGKKADEGWVLPYSVSVNSMDATALSITVSNQ